MTKKKETTNTNGKAGGKPVRPSRYGACASRKLPKQISDPAAPPKGAPRPVRGIGSKAAERSSVPLEWHGHRMSRAAWARYLHISIGTLAYRLRHYSVEEALSPNFRDIMQERAKARGGWGAKTRHITERGREVLRRNATLAHAASHAKATRYTAFGESLTCSEWAERLGVQWHTLYLRLKRMPVEDALRTGRFANGHKPAASAAAKGSKNAKPSRG